VESAWFRTEREAGAGWQVRTLKGHWDWVTSVAISADGKSVVSGSRDTTVKIWDVETGAVVRGGCLGRAVRLAGGVEGWNCAAVKGSEQFRGLLSDLRIQICTGSSVYSRRKGLSLSRRFWVRERE